MKEKTKDGENQPNPAAGPTRCQRILGWWNSRSSRTRWTIAITCFILASFIPEPILACVLIVVMYAVVFVVFCAVTDEPIEKIKEMNCDDW